MRTPHTVPPITPQPERPPVIVPATHEADFDNPPSGVVIVRPGYRPED